ncbi:DUF7146 domain-containing protein [Phaeobacter gallaeciensis]|uniref:DUF7146 domain-containing protein n=1 Tax=Phaeobacter gallaeciensis TaxID=60890 RepID=UPI00237FCD86|nr:primase-helicase zinc-binding domain-containing protein [Phaeobacter gallaeciensis]MDE4059758.1 primase-helicase zinc-binding domain-containing protein [Phaeobacter gallaeciensis]MDE4122605.1 primase-helicase zinc-binding domain-containing protein [Phaeobacter gallaeciensis]MDE4127245.1 primase-helicase zinc-binding domain-containing protein [Phaeobacter gallaeciensis]
MIRDDGRKAAAKVIPILEVAQRLGIGGMRRAGVERVGACPVCGGRDRFSINPARGVWNCRICDRGGDGLALAEHVLACNFQAALDFLVGKADVAPDPAEVARRKAAAKAAERQRRDYEARARARAIRDAREIWHAAKPGEGTAAEEYLAARGVRFPAWPPTLRFSASHPYMKHWPGRGVVEWFRGPCMIAGVQDAAGRVTAVHQTWVDARRPGSKLAITAPDGSLVDDKGKKWPAKLVRGSKKGGAVRLTPLGTSGVMIMGEGIETTASAIAAGIKPAAAFWAGVDLGNMAGRQVKLEGVRHSGQPDLGDTDAWLPPDGITQLVFIQDGDSDPKPTRAKLLSGIRRAAACRPGLRGWIVKAETGRDLNDMRMEQIENDRD